MLDYGLHQRQVQKLVMTPKLRQSIAILQMPAQELAAYVAQQIVDNPALDPDTSEDEAEESRIDAAQEPPSEDPHDTDWHEYFDHVSDLGHVKDSRGGLGGADFALRALRPLDANAARLLDGAAG